VLRKILGNLKRFLELSALLEWAQKLDVVVEVDAGLLIRALIALIRSLRQRAQRRAFQLDKELAAGLFVHAHRPFFQIRQKSPDVQVELSKAEARHVAQTTH